MLQLAGLQIVKVELAPVVALREPDRFVRARQVLPVDASVARLEEGLALFLEHVADRAGRGVGDAQVGLLVVARRRDERHLAAVGTPLHVDPLAAALHVVAERRAVLILVHLEADDLRAVDLDHDALDHRDVLVAGQRILPGPQRRMPGGGVDEIHVAGLALILLEGGDLLRIGRPLEHRPIAADPAGVVGGVAVVLDAVGRELLVRAGRHVANPEVVVADEGRVACRQATSRCSEPVAGRSADVHCCALHVAGPALVSRCRTRTTCCRRRT